MLIALIFPFYVRAVSGINFEVIWSRWARQLPAASRTDPYMQNYRVRSMNPTYHMMGQQVTVASLVSSSTAAGLRSQPPTMHTAGAQT